MDYEEYYKKYINIFENYVSNYNKEDALIEKKRTHSYRVAIHAAKIAQSINLNQEQIDIAKDKESRLSNIKYQDLEDDRSERPGIKFADSDLIGIPLRIVIGKKITEGILEIKIRETGETIELNIDDLEMKIKDIYTSIK